MRSPNVLLVDEVVSTRRVLQHNDYHAIGTCLHATAEELQSPDNISGPQFAPKN